MMLGIVGLFLLPYIIKTYIKQSNLNFDLTELITPQDTVYSVVDPKIQQHLGLSAGIE
jgi:hypothetical protein